jgi:hypothetical protein
MKVISALLLHFFSPVSPKMEQGYFSSKTFDVVNQLFRND